MASKPSPKGKPKAEPARETIVNIKGTREYALWLESLYEATHINKSLIVRLALKDWAEKQGLPAPPKF